LKTEEALIPRDTPAMARLLTTVMFASIIVGLLLSNQWDLRMEPLQVEAGRGATASLEMMRLLRDEHGLVAEMVKAQLAVSGGTFDSNATAATERGQAIAMR
jgi:hypothetical protein